MKLRAAQILLSVDMSPSARREWVEIYMVISPTLHNGSPSARREWVEIRITEGVEVLVPVSLREEGVG